MERISGHTFYIAKYFHHKLAHLRHSSGVNVAEIYTNGNVKDPETQGGVVNFNLFRANGDYIGFAEVRESAKRGITCKQVSFFKEGVQPSCKFEVKNVNIFSTGLFMPKTDRNCCPDIEKQ